MEFLVFWVVVPCNAVVAYHRADGPCCLRLEELNSPLKLRYPAITLHGAAVLKTTNSVFTAVKTSTHNKL